MIKDLLKLIKLLVSDPVEIKELQVCESKYFPFKGHLCMMWCGTIFVRKGLIDKVDQFTINHKTLHLLQAQNEGSWIKYYSKYLWEWIKGNPLLGTSKAAYYTIPYEMEAYANEHRRSYIENYNPRLLGSYTYQASCRNQLYNDHRFEWFRFCREINPVDPNEFLA
jgi:hypothetical protein